MEVAGISFPSMASLLRGNVSLTHPSRAIGKSIISLTGFQLAPLRYEVKLSLTHWSRVLNTGEGVRGRGKKQKNRLPPFLYIYLKKENNPPTPSPWEKAA